VTEPGTPRLGGSLLAVGIGIALIVAVALLPDLAPDIDMPVVGQQNEHARIVAELDPDEAGLSRFEVELLDGADAGTSIEALVQDGSGAMPGSASRTYAVGDEVVVSRFTGPAGGFAVISEPWRVPLLALAAAAFAVAVLIVGGLKGVRSLVALALTVVVVAKVVVPLLLRGWDPILVAVGVGVAVTVVTLVLTEGFSRVTLSATLGTFAALVLTAVLAAAFTAAAEFTVLQGTEEIAFLIPMVGDRLDLQGILLAATVFAALGVLDDVTVTQAATVEGLHRAQPADSRRAVAARALRIGRSHIAATVNTLVLAYLGAGLPLLLLFALGGQAPLLVLNGEVVAVEVVRALVGSIGIVAAMPLTTAVAALLCVPRDASSARGGTLEPAELHGESHA
jgi:uncharacterized membrane protein